MTTGGQPPDASSAPSAGFLGDVPEPLVPPGGGWTYIERPDALARLAQQLIQVRVLAIDAEFVQIYHRGPDEPPHRLALLQLAGAPGVPGAFVVDALRLPDLTPLQQALGDPAILKLFHGMGADVPVLATRGLVARHMLDLEAASRSIFGSHESSLQKMLQRACGIRMDKSLQRSDWTRRPLPPAMLAYAARDAQMTLALYDWLALRYPWAVALHEAPADLTPPVVAGWLAGLLDGARGQRAEWVVAQAGLADDHPRQVADLRAALNVVRLPAQRARLLRVIGGLGRVELVAEIRPELDANAAEVRAAAARTLGWLRDTAAEPLLRARLGDPVQDMREAAQAALELLFKAPQPSAPSRVTRSHAPGATRWTLDATASGEDGGAPVEAPWQAALRARFASAAPADAPPGDDDDEPAK